MLALATLVPGTAAAAESEHAQTPRVVIAVLPAGTGVERIARSPLISPGTMSAGLGSVPAAQTYLDISQGNRVNERLYDDPLPPAIFLENGVPPDLWAPLAGRAADAPADLVPGLLASTLEDAGVRVRIEAGAGAAGLIGVDRSGKAVTVPPARCGVRGCGPGLSVIRAEPGELPAIAANLRGRDLLLAFADAFPDGKLLPAGAAGTGAESGDLTSSSTRTDGVFIATDVGPTVIERLGVRVPKQMNGTTITASGDRDPDGVADLREKLADRPNREIVALGPLAVWSALAALASLAFGRRGARRALPLLALAAAWAPSFLLLVAALDASEAAAALITLLGAGAMAILSAAILPGPRGLALACLVTVLAHAIDVVAGSPLTALSVLGPNPGGGVRFFGIGNELEATLATLTLIGTGSWLCTRPADGRRAAVAFAAVALAAAAAFAPGRFGADVGAAIVLGVGAAAAAALSLGLSRRRTVIAVIAAGAGALVALVAVDLIGGGAHLTRSVLRAGDAHDVIDVFDRRLSLMIGTFTDPVYPELLIVAAIVLVTGLVRRRTVAAWFGERSAARNGFIGALVGVLIGTVANDSGSVLLVIGTIFLATSAGFYWATGPSAGEAGGPSGSG